MRSVTNHRVLVIEDNRELAEVIRSQFEEQSLETRVTHTAAEAESAYGDGPWAALITDLLLPDLTGHRLVRRLAAAAPLPPVFVITGVFKGAKKKAELSAVAPIGGWFEKPFDVRVLVGTICRALGHPYRARSERTAAEDEALRTYEAVQLVAGYAVGQASDDTSVELVGDRNPQAAPRSGVSAGVPRRLGSRRSDPFNDAQTGFFRSTTPSAHDMSTGLRNQLKSGDLGTVPAARLIGAFHVARETGEVAFEEGGRRQIVYFDSGRPVYSASNRSEDRLGNFIADQLRLDQTAVSSAREEARTHGRALTSVLIQRGWVDRPQLDRVVHRHTRQMLLNLFSWADGAYRIRFQRREDLPTPEASIDTGRLVLEGVRDRFTLARLSELLPDFVRPMPSPNSPFHWYALPIDDHEARALLLVTGSRTVRELADKAPPELDERRVRALVYGLLVLGVLVAGRSRSRPIAPATDGGGDQPSNVC